jgi:predicted small metal-binding protein
MYEFRCAVPYCKTHFTAPTEGELMGDVAKHVAVTHRIPNPSKSLVQFVKANTIRELPPTKAG